LPTVSDSQKIFPVKIVCIFLPILTLLVLSTGCASPRPLVSAWHNSDFSPTPVDKIAMTLTPNPSAKDAELGRLLTVELRREGFYLVPLEKADYLLACTADGERGADRQQVITITASAGPSQTSDQFFSPLPPVTISGSVSNTPSTATLEPGVAHAHSIRLVLYTNPKNNPAGFQVAWQGYIASASSEREMALVRTLLGYFGREQHGPVTLTE
jgi:hypothetical protein